MNTVIVLIFQVIGSLGLFLFGMSMMSEALQKVAGNKMRSILSSMTRNRIFGLLTGVAITAFIQSSSATTVMVVSFVNAGLLSLAESISVIMGANIGTTVTAWIVSIIGKFSVADIAIPMIGIAIPFVFSKKDKRKSIGQVLVGFGLLFLGLDFLKNSVPDLQSSPEVLEFIKGFTGYGYGSILVFLLFGTILTIIVQSSSAAMAITLILLANGWISLEIAAAIVLGENIGTTITANLAALTANTTSKRAALSHTLFNILGVIWLLIIFRPFLTFVSGIAGYDQAIDLIPSGSAHVDPTAVFALSLFHTCFNVVNAFIMIWFVNMYEKIVCKIIREKADDRELALQFISSGMLQTGELSLFEAEKELEVYTQRTSKMFETSRKFALNKYENKNNQNLYERVVQFEDASDKTEIAIGDYMYAISATPVSASLKNNIRNYLYLTTEVESVADRCYNITRSAKRRNDEKIIFTETQNAHLNDMFALIEKQLMKLETCVKNKFAIEEDRKDIFKIEEDVNSLRYDLKIKNVDLVNKGEHSYSSGIYFMDIIEECESLGDAITKIAREVRIEK